MHLRVHPKLFATKFVKVEAKSATRRNSVEERITSSETLMMPRTLVYT